MCNFCNEGSQDLGQSIYFTLSENEILIVHGFDNPGGEIKERIKIKYCPLCGRHLEKPEINQKI